MITGSSISQSRGGSKEKEKIRATKDRVEGNNETRGEDMEKETGMENKKGRKNGRNRVGSESENVREKLKQSKK